MSFFIKSGYHEGEEMELNTMRVTCQMDMRSTRGLIKAMDWIWNHIEVETELEAKMTGALIREVQRHLLNYLITAKTREKDNIYAALGGCVSLVEMAECNPPDGEVYLGQAWGVLLTVIEWLCKRYTEKSGTRQRKLFSVEYITELDDKIFSQIQEKSEKIMRSSGRAIQVKLEW